MRLDLRCESRFTTLAAFHVSGIPETWKHHVAAWLMFFDDEPVAAKLQTVLDAGQVTFALINIYKTLVGGSANETEKLSPQPGIDLSREPPGEVGEDLALGVHAVYGCRPSTLCQEMLIHNVNPIEGGAANVKQLSTRCRSRRQYYRAGGWVNEADGRAPRSGGQD